MARQCDRLTGILCWPLEDVLSRPVVLDEIEIRRSKFLETIAEVANNRDRLQEYLRQNNCRADIDIHSTAIQLTSHSTEEAKILIRCFAESFAGCLRMRVYDVGADGNMYCHRHVCGIGFRKNTAGAVLESNPSRTPAANESAQAFAQPDLVGGRGVNCGVHILAGFPGHPEAAFPELFFDFFRRRAPQSDLKIVNGGRTIHRYSCNESSLHEVVDDRSKSYFDNVPAEAPEDRFPRGPRIEHRADEFSQAFTGQNVRQFGYESQDIFGPVYWFSEHRRADFALP